MYDIRHVKIVRQKWHNDQQTPGPPFANPLCIHIPSCKRPKKKTCYPPSYPKMKYCTTFSFYVPELEERNKIFFFFPFTLFFFINIYTYIFYVINAPRKIHAEGHTILHTLLTRRGSPCSLTPPHIQDNKLNPHPRPPKQNFVEDRRLV